MEQPLLTECKYAYLKRLSTQRDVCRVDDVAVTVPIHDIEVEGVVGIGGGRLAFEGHDHRCDTSDMESDYCGDYSLRRWDGGQHRGQER